MSFRMGAANGQYRAMGAEGCILIKEGARFSPTQFDEMFEQAESELAVVRGDEYVVQIGDDSRLQETYTQRALRSSLKLK